MVQSAFQQTLEDKLNFQRDNNLKHMAKYTMSVQNFKDTCSFHDID
jgi:hypothetical protein